MKKPKNHKAHLLALAQYMKPLAADNHQFKNFKLSQQHKGVKK